MTASAFLWVLCFKDREFLSGSVDLTSRFVQTTYFKTVTTVYPAIIICPKTQSTEPFQIEVYLWLLCNIMELSHEKLLG